jgi:hypothetical protein
VTVLSWASSVNIVTKLWAGPLGFDYWQGRDFSLCNHKSSSGAHPTYPMGTGGKAARA